ncbi:hypothetical protein K503DRAFT_773757 [Rhizopogon vinicolor AM-OR11-026]|uniref:Uncharacterized protein n=1 Tax=Rhizopogon vinicolor AM-OR11-026 TaxID=1314800 RepID=A0A1B7MRE9_9AGAM|nr:hypothetical protein K503DRAFT_773757 [Rhizopogon vinicolor AM-OR11-026]
MCRCQPPRDAVNVHGAEDSSCHSDADSFHDSDEEADNVSYDEEEGSHDEEGSYDDEDKDPFYAAPDHSVLPFL